MISLRKWEQTFKTSWSKYMAYRSNLFLQIVGPALVFFFIKYNLWTSIYAGDEQVLVAGYKLEDMIQYHIWAFIISMMAQGHTAMDLGEEIRLGRISSYLIYPFNFWEFHSATFFAFQSYQLIVSCFSLLVFYMLGLLSTFTWLGFFQGLLFCQFISIFWFILQFATGLMAFWLDETWILRVILSIMTAFLSGSFFPLEIYPTWIQDFLYYTPFPYLTYFPVKVFMGQITDFGPAILSISLWMIIGIGLNRYLWKKGLRLYTAAGM